MSYSKYLLTNNNVSEFLNEDFIGNDIINEMHFSINDLQNPKTIDRIEKNKDMFENIRKYMLWLFGIVDVAAGFILGGKLNNAAKVKGSRFVIISLLLIVLSKIASATKAIPQKQYEKDISKYKAKVHDLIKKMEEKKKEDPENASEYQKIIDNCQNVLDEFERREKEQKKQQLNSIVDELEELYNDFVDWWKKPDTFGHTGSGLQYASVLIGQLYGITEKEIINHSLKNMEKLHADSYDMILSEYDVERAKSEFKNSDYIILSSDDEHSRFIITDTGNLYETDIGYAHSRTEKDYSKCGVFSSVKGYDDLFNNKEAIIELDKRLGIYKFSPCPDSVKKKKFLDRDENISESVDSSKELDDNIINESAIASFGIKLLKLVTIFVGLFFALISIIAIKVNVDEKKLKKFMESHPLLKKYLQEIEQLSRKMIIDGVKDPIVVEHHNTTKREGLSGGFAFINRKPVSYSVSIAEFDFTKICEEFNFNDYEIDHEGTLWLYKSNPQSKEIFDECKSRHKKCKLKIKEIEKEIKSLKHGDLLSIGFNEWINPDDDDKYAICYSSIILNIKIKNISDFDNDEQDIIENFKKSISESTDLSLQEAFMYKDEKLAKKKNLSDLEFSYDKKFNGFCLSVSGYSIEKLEDALSKKNQELLVAASEKKSAKEKYEKLEAQVKIDYLENCKNKLQAMIKKKKSYQK